MLGCLELRDDTMVSLCSLELHQRKKLEKMEDLRIEGRSFCTGKTLKFFEQIFLMKKLLLSSLLDRPSDCLGLSMMGPKSES